MLVSLILMNARAAALVHKDRSAHGVYINDTEKEYVLFKGTTYTPHATSNRAIPFTSRSITVSSSGGDTIIFSAHTGNIILGTGTISVASTIATHTITLNTVGQIDW
jgi:hypothetical protein